MSDYPLEPEDELSAAWNEIEQEWDTLGDEWENLAADHLRDEAPTLVLRKHLPKLIARYKAGMNPQEIHEMDQALLKMDKHVIYTAQLYLNILEVGFDKHQAFVLLCNTLG